MIDLTDIRTFRESMQSVLEVTEIETDTLASLQKVVESTELTFDAIQQANIGEAEKAAATLLLLNRTSEAAGVRSLGPKNLSEFLGRLRTIPKLRGNPFAEKDCHVEAEGTRVFIDIKATEQGRLIFFTTKDDGTIGNWDMQEKWNLEAFDFVCDLLDDYKKALPKENSTGAPNPLMRTLRGQGSPKKNVSLLLDALREERNRLKTSEEASVAALEKAVLQPATFQWELDQASIDAVGVVLNNSKSRRSGSTGGAPNLGRLNYRSLIETLNEDETQRINECMICLSSLKHSQITNELAHEAGLSNRMLHILSVFRVIALESEDADVKRALDETDSPQEAALRLLGVPAIEFQLRHLELVARTSEGNRQNIARKAINHDLVPLNRDDPVHSVSFDVNENLCFIGTHPTNRYKIDTNDLKKYSTASLIELLHVLHKHMTSLPTGPVAVLKKSDVEHGIEFMQRVSEIVSERIEAQRIRDDEILQALGPLQGLDEAPSSSTSSKE